MTENELRVLVCAQAACWLGCCEGNGSHRGIIDVYNQIVPRPRGYKLQYSDPWCAGFVSAVAQALGLTAWIYPECGCGPMVELYRKAGRWMEDDAYLPALADVIFYDWDDSGTGDNRGIPDHVGIVLSVDGDQITVIEGNCGKTVAKRKVQRDGRYIRGYGLPDYAVAAAVLTESGKTPAGSAATESAPEGESGKESASQSSAAAVPLRCRVSLPILQVGDAGEAVWAGQMLLQGRGYPVGPSGCDGEFGPRTRSAMRRFQLAHGLECDGVLGPESWGCLIGGER